MAMKTVTVEVVEVGSAFALKAVIRDAKSNRKLAETDEVPFGMDGNAQKYADTLIAAKGWRRAESD